MEASESALMEKKMFGKLSLISWTLFDKAKQSKRRLLFNGHDLTSQATLVTPS